MSSKLIEYAVIISKFISYMQKFKTEEYLVPDQ